MGDSVRLIGAETVSLAASRMQEAATDMQQAASQFDESLRLHAPRVEEWLGRFEAVAVATTLQDAAKAQIEHYKMLQRPSVLYRPELGRTLNGMWKASYGTLEAYGDSPEKAFSEFDEAWRRWSGAR